jgi:hypothetical protein
MKGDNLKSKTGIEMRAAAAARAQQADPNFAAKQHEASFLRHITTAKEHYDWIVDNEAWIQLGHATYTDWYLAKVQPILLALGARPTPELAGDIFNRVRDDEAELAPSQRRTQQEMAELTGLSRRTVQRLSQDLSGAPLAPGADLADSTVVDPVSLISDEAKAAIAARLDETSPGAAVPEDGEEGTTGAHGPVEPSEPPAEDHTSEESDPVVPVATSSAPSDVPGVASDGAPAGQEEPSAGSPPAAPQQSPSLAWAKDSPEARLAALRRDLHGFMAEGWKAMDQIKPGEVGLYLKPQVIEDVEKFQRELNSWIDAIVAEHRKYARPRLVKEA